MTSIGITKNPRSNILYNSITEEMDKVSDELRAMLDRKEETIAEQREEIGILKKQMEELREKSKSSDETLNEFKALQKQFDELKANAETYKADSDRLREQEAKAKEKLIKEIVGDDTKGMEMFQKFSVEELEHMKNTKIVTEPVKGVGSQSVDTITDGDADDTPSEDKIDEYSQEYFEKWERENTHW
jgi:septal ring factor EnvC (AmiA/AmiB activator)